MKRWRDGSEAIRRVRLSRGGRATRPEGGFSGEERPTVGEWQTAAAELIIVEVVTEAGEAVKDTVPPDHPGTAAV